MKNSYTYIIINATPATQIKKLRKYRTRRGKKNETIDITKHRLLAIPTSSIFHQNDERTSRSTELELTYFISVSNLYYIFTLTRKVANIQSHDTTHAYKHLTKKDDTWEN